MEGVALPKLFLCAFLAAWAAAAREPGALPDLIPALKQHQRALGIPETRNFETHAAAREAFFRCYYTGKLELPDSYDELRYQDGTASGCALDPEVWDVLFYPAEAVADGAAPVTASLAAAPEPRQAVVVAHEDLHEALHRLPVHLAEAATTLAAFLTAADFARASRGESSESFQALAGEAELFRAKAEVVNSYHARLGRLYRAVRRGELTAQEALAEKARIFGELERACLAISPEPRTFNRCPAALNNAGLAFDYTYTKHYALFWDLYRAVCGDLRRLIDVLLEISRRHAKEHEAVAELEQRIRGASCPLH